MNKFYTIIFAALLFTTSAFAQSACEKTREEKGYPMHYCACYEDNTRLNALPIDTTITDSVWFKSTLKVFINSGMTAYLYSETDVYFDIYQRCTTQKTLFDTVIAHNRAFEIDGASLSDKLAENGQSNANMAIYVCIYPKEEGIPSRVLCYPYGQGPASTCDDILPIVPGMTFVSSHTNDVYELEATTIPENGDLEVEWFNYTGNCSLTISRGNCNGTKVVDVDLVEPYKIDRELMRKARDNGESLYLHFVHAEGTAGRIRVNKTEYIDVITTDTAVCRTQGLQLPDTLLTESTVYPYDTIQYAAGVYHILKYRVTILESKSHYETVEACESYTWNGETYTKSGDYVYTTTATNGCDSIVTLHLTINQSVATEETVFACDSYEWNGATYTTSGDYTYTTATANGCDSVVSLHLTIYQSETAEETVVACDSYEWNGTTYTESGDYTYFSAADNGCDRIVTLRLTIHQSETVEETVVACDSYSWNGATYTESGDYTYITTTDNGCDRVEILHLTIDICSAVEDVPATSEEIRKILQGDQILILRNGQTYTLMGETL